jgi:hypothetical protein
MIDTTNAELTLTLEPSGLASTKIRGTISFHCDTWLEETLTSVDQVPQAAKDAIKGCIQDVLYGELINIMLGLHGSTLRLVEYNSPIYKHVKAQFDAAFEQMRLHNVPFTEPLDPDNP